MLAIAFYLDNVLGRCFAAMVAAIVFIALRRAIAYLVFALICIRHSCLRSELIRYDNGYATSVPFVGMSGKLGRMNFELERGIEVLSATPGTLRTMLGGLSDEWTASRGDAWQAFDVVGI